MVDVGMTWPAPGCLWLLTGPSVVTAAAGEGDTLLYRPGRGARVLLECSQAQGPRAVRGGVLILVKRPFCTSS